MEFTKSFLKKMEKLQKANKYFDLDLKHKVTERMYELEEDANDEQLDLWGAMIDAEDDNEYWEYWNTIHALASSLDIK